MKYALGNMLNGAGSINPDKLALDLQFAADKTLTARRGPTPSFSRGSTGTFVGSNGLIQSAAINAPRFDHDPVTLASRGLLIEESRTNLLQRSEEFDNTYWTPTRAPQPTANAAVSPDGLTTADKLIADTTAANNHRVDRSPVTLALNTIYTVSVFAKAGEYTGIALGVGLVATRGVDYSLVGAGTATPVSGAGHTGTIQQLANGWYRCTATFTSDATTAAHRVAIYVGQNGTTFTYTGDNTSGIFIWGAQLEAGSFATSYIPTTTSALTRSADVCTISSTAFSTMWNTAEGTLLISGDKTMSQNTSGSYLSLQSGTTEVGPLMSRTSTTLIGRIRNSAGTDLTNTDTSQSPSGEKKVAVTWRATSDAADRDYASDGVILAKSNPNAGTAAGNQTTLIIGSRSSSSWFNGTISYLRYYRKRLPNAKLQALTV